MDAVPRVILRMLTSLAMLLTLAVIVFGIHMYARTADMTEDTLSVGGNQVNKLRKPDPRIFDLTLGPPPTDAPAPHQGSLKMKDAPSSPETHTTTQPPTETRSPTTESSGGHTTRTTSKTSLGNMTTEKPTPTRVPEQTTAPDRSPGANETASDKQGMKDPPVPTTNVSDSPSSNDKDGTVCPTVHKSFCNVNGAAQFFYDPDEGSCLSATVQMAHVCNRSPNQFASIEDCLAACVKGRWAPEHRCVQKPRFVACTAEDARGDWWFHDGRKCVPWSFAGGRCPLASAPVFDTAAVCGAQCNDSRTRRERGCLLPVSQLCEPSQLRLPFFAAPSVTDKGTAFQCHRVEWEFLLRHRCLLGSNAFVNRDECHETCRRRMRQY
ncbi:uncharacterized protein LOC144127934 [Amblyomma americanum]